MARNDERKVTISAEFRDRALAGLQRFGQLLGGTRREADATARSGSALGRALRGLGDVADRAGRRLRVMFRGVGDGLRGVMRSALSMNGLIVGVLAGVVAGRTVAAIKNVSNELDRIAKLGGTLGIAAPTLARLAVAGDLAGVELEALGTSVQRLQRNLAEAARDPAGAAGKLFAGIGVAAVDAEGGIRDVMDVLPELADRFAAIPDQAERIRVAVGLLGRTGADLLPLLQTGGDALRRTFREVETLSPSLLSPQTYANAEALNDSLSRVSLSFKGLAALIIEVAGADLAAFFDGVAASIGRAVGRIRDFAAQLRQSLGALRQLVGDAYFNVELDEAGIRDAREQLGRVLDGVESLALELVEAVLQAIVAGAEAAGEAFASVFGDAVTNKLNAVFGDAVIEATPEVRLPRLREELDREAGLLQIMGNSVIAGAQVDQTRFRDLQRRVAELRQVVAQTEREVQDREASLASTQAQAIASTVERLRARLKAGTVDVRAALDDISATLSEVQLRTAAAGDAAATGANRFKILSGVFPAIRRGGEGAVAMIKGFTAQLVAGVQAAGDFTTALEVRMLRALGKVREASRLEFVQRQEVELRAAPAAQRPRLQAVQRVELQRFDFEESRTRAVDALTAAEGRHAQALQNVEARLKAGNLTRVQARELIERQDVALQGAIATARAELATLAQGDFGAEVADELAQIETKLAELEAAARARSQDFGVRFNLGFQSATAAAADFGDTAQQVGETVGQSFLGIGDLLVDAFTRGGVSFREFAASVLSDIAKIILRFSLLKLLTASPLGGVLGLSGGGQAQPLRAGGVVRNAAAAIVAPVAGFRDGVRQALATGGPVGATVPGARTHRDTHTDALPAGSFVVREASSDRYRDLLPLIESAGPEARERLVRLVDAGARAGRAVGGAARMVRVMLTPGERVVPPQVVQRYGGRFFDAINRGAISPERIRGALATASDTVRRFNVGGAVLGPGEILQRYFTLPAPAPMLGLATGGSVASSFAPTIRSAVLSANVAAAQETEPRIVVQPVIVRDGPDMAGLADAIKQNLLRDPRFYGKGGR